MLLDTWAWVEFFKGTRVGAKVRQAINSGVVYVSVLTLAELADWCVRNSLDSDRYLREVVGAATVVRLDGGVAMAAGSGLSRLRKSAPGIGMVDVLIYSQARILGIPLLTGDSHLRGLPGIEVLG